MSIQLSGADIIDLAVQSEVHGEAFYHQAARKADRADAKALFQFLAKEEARHRQVFEELSAGIVVTEVDPTTWQEAVEYIVDTVDRALFEAKAPIRAIPTAATVEDMLRLAAGFEKQTLLFFYQLRDLVQPANRALLDEIIAEEKRHVRRLSLMLAECTAKPA